MKRPFAVIGITYLISQSVAAYFGASFALAAAISFILCLIVYLFFSEKRNEVLITGLITATVAMLAFFAYSKLHVERMIPLEGNTVYIEGRIAEEPETRYGRYYYVIRTNCISESDMPQNTKIRVSSASSLEADYSDVFKGTVTFSSMRCDNDYYAHKQMLSSGITATAYLSNDCGYSISEGKGDIYSIAIMARRLLKDNIGDLYPDETGDILIGMMTGDDSRIDPRIVNAFRNTGIAHILAISGLHLTLLAGAVTWFLRRFLINRKIIAAIVIAVSWFFASIAGFPISSLRAAIMITVMLIGVIFDRQHSPLNSLGIAILLICIFNPYAAANAGLMMSFSATFGLIEAAPRINRYVLKKTLVDKSDITTSVLRSIISAFVTSATASLFILPASVLCFGKVSLMSPIANVLLIPLAEVFLVFGMIAVFLCFFGSIGTTIAYFFMTADWFIGKIVLAVTEYFNRFPDTVLNTGAGIGVTLTVFGCVLIGVVWAVRFRNSKHRKKAFLAGVFSCLAIVTVWYCSEIVLKDTRTVTVYSVGDSAMILARDGEHTVLLGAGGDSYGVTLAKYDMNDKGISDISALVLTDMSESGASCADSLIQTMEPQKVFTLSDGYYCDNIEYMTEKYNTPLGSSENIAVSSGEVTVSNLTDDCGLIWSQIECGKLNVLVCPRNGNIKDCPFGLKYDSVIFTDSIPEGAKTLDSKSYIICSEYRTGARLKNQLMSMNFENVYCTGTDGNIELAFRDGRLLIGGENI